MHHSSIDHRYQPMKTHVECSLLHNLMNQGDECSICLYMDNFKSRTKIKISNKKKKQSLSKSKLKHVPKANV